MSTTKEHEFDLEDISLYVLYAAAEAGVFKAVCLKCNKECIMWEMFGECLGE